MSPPLPFSLSEGRNRNHRSLSCAPQTPPPHGSPPASSMEQPPSFSFDLQLGFISSAPFPSGPPASVRDLRPCDSSETSDSQLPKHLSCSMISLCPGVPSGWLVTLLIGDPLCRFHQAPAGIPLTFSPCCLETCCHLLRPWAPVETLALFSQGWIPASPFLQLRGQKQGQ